MKQQVGERRLRALDLARQHGLLPHVGPQEEILVVQPRRGPVETTDRRTGAAKELEQLAVENERGTCAGLSEIFGGSVTARS